jgi:hypothetical protein
VAIDSVAIGKAKARGSGSDAKVPTFVDTTAHDTLHDLLPLVREWMLDDTFCPTSNADIATVRSAQA